MFVYKLENPLLHITKHKMVGKMCDRAGPSMTKTSWIVPFELKYSCIRSLGRP